ncbi:MAG TPA: hypothetical protein VF488_05790, partial [Gemmatimonadaceae bacterium]
LLRFWDVQTGRPLWTMPAHKLRVTGIHFAAGDIVTRGFGGEISRWHLPEPSAVIGAGKMETIISDTRIPADRQVVYALELLAGVRTGEAAAPRWRHYDATMRPLGKLLVAKSYNMRKNREKSTKTDAVKHVPVHPVLAAMLANWKLGGWAEMMGRADGG